MELGHKSSLKCQRQRSEDRGQRWGGEEMMIPLLQSHPGFIFFLILLLVFFPFQ